MVMGFPALFAVFYAHCLNGDRIKSETSHQRWLASNPTSVEREVDMEWGVVFANQTWPDPEGAAALAE
jgi:hypothetical protein